VVSTLLHPERKRIYIDGDAKTDMVTWFSQPAPPFDPDKQSIFPGGVPYFLRPNRESVLVIGAGGGNDIWSALRGGARRVDAVEINPSTYHIGQEVFRKENGGIFHVPGVTLWNEEGRSFVRRNNQRYDNITIYGIDTFAAISSGAYMLSENYLYTVEAMKDFIGHLTPTGTLCITRWDYAGEAARLFTVMLEALHQMNTPSPKDHIMVMSASSWELVMVSPAPFTESEVTRIREQAQRYKTLFYYPLPRENWDTHMQRFCNHYASLREVNDISATAHFGRYNVSPVYDDSPFFFHYERARDMLDVFREKNTLDFMRGHGASFTLVALILLLVVAVIVFMFLPLMRLGRVALPHFGSWLVYFACLGVAFIFVEIALMQRFALLLGHPSRSLAMVLASLLFFAGVGSYLRSFLRVSLEAILAALAAILLVVAFLYPHLITAALGQPLWIRSIVTIAMVAPAALLMGMPFPTGLRAVSNHGNAAIPWMWGVNGGTTVLGSILAIIVAISTNFTTVLVLAAVAYLLALVMYYRASRTPESVEMSVQKTE
jgi:spermidine synthase